MVLLQVEDLTVRLEKNEEKILVDQVSFQLEDNTCLGILGESGSGKTMLCRALLGLLDKGIAREGKAFLKGVDLLGLPRQEMRSLLGRSCCMILQNPMTAFDPLCTVGYQIIETFCARGRCERRTAKEAAEDVLERMRFHEPAQIMNKYPHQLSGGMLQRIMIALALAAKPDLIVADEPTTALDAVTQYEVMEEFVRLRRETKTAMIFVSHDFGAISKIADQVMVMHQGQVMEAGTRETIFCRPENAYTRRLIGTRAALMEKYRLALRQAEQGGNSRAY